MKGSLKPDNEGPEKYAKDFNMYYSRSLKDVQTVISKIYKNVTWNSKNNFIDVIKLNILSWGDYLM